MENKRLKILCLHGRGQNKHFMDSNLRYFKKITGDLAEYESVNGPFYYPYPAVRSKPPFYGWLDDKNHHSLEIRQISL